ncbi:MAG: hypothetical protein HN348_01450 [Proteobacteria bacterium]|jgi:Tol biopolymer transport system component|nr:hypothetical protein [Pseudomonadota bacterium]
MRTIAMMLFLGLTQQSVYAGEVEYDGEGHAYTPVFSLDGKYLAFEVNRYAGDIDLYVTTLDGANAATVAKVALPGDAQLGWGTGQALVNPTWHPQGVLLYEGASSDGRFRLYSHQPGGGSHSSEMISLDELPGDLTFPVVSADGDNMAFVSDQTGKGDIRVRDTMTATLGSVTKSAQSEMCPQFDRDGRKILYSRKNEDQESAEDIYLISASGEGEVLVVGGTGDQTRPNFAGSRIVFFDGSRGDNIWDLATVDRPGGTKKVLAQGVRLPLRARPAVSPNGQWVAFSFEEPAKQNKIVLVKVDGTKTIDVSTPYKACGEPAFGLQGGKLFLAYTALPSADADWRLLHIEDISGKI